MRVPYCSASQRQQPCDLHRAIVRERSLRSCLNLCVTAARLPIVCWMVPESQCVNLMSSYFSMPSARYVLLLLGGVGTLLCLATIGGVWWLDWRVNVVRQKLAAAVDGSLEQVQQRLTSARELVDEAKLTAGEIEQRLGRWTRDEVTDRVVERLELGKQLDRLEHCLKQAEYRLEFAKAPTGFAEWAVEWGQSATLPVDTNAIDEFADQLTKLEMRLHSLTEGVTALKAELAGDQPDESGHIARAAKLAARLVATFGNIDQRLDLVGSRIATVRELATNLAIRTRRQLLLAAALATLLLLWMAVGQISLLRRGLEK